MEEEELISRLEELRKDKDYLGGTKFLMKEDPKFARELILSAIAVKTHQEIDKRFEEIIKSVGDQLFHKMKEVGYSHNDTIDLLTKGVYEGFASYHTSAMKK